MKSGNLNRAKGRNRRGMRIIISLATLACVSASQANTATSWKGNTGSWTDPTQWTGGVVPVNNSPSGTLYDVSVPSGLINITGTYSDTVQSLNISTGNISGASATITAMSGFYFGGTGPGAHAYVNVAVLNSPAGAITTVNSSGELNITTTLTETFLNGGTFDMLSGSFIGTFNNSGSIVVNAGGGIVDMSGATIGTGSLNVQSGTFRVTPNTGNWMGQLVPTMAAGTGMALWESVAANDTSTYTLFAFNSPSANLFVDNCRISIANNRSYGAANTQVSNGRLTINSPNASTANLTLMNGSTFSMLGSSGKFLVTGNFDGSGNANLSAGAIYANGSSGIYSGTLSLLSGTSFVNNGTFSLTPSTISLQSGALVNNGTMTVGAGAFNVSGGGGFINTGLLDINPGAGGIFSIPYGLIFNHSGTAVVQSGELRIYENSVGTGTYNISTGSSVFFGGKIQNPIAILGSGTATFNGSSGYVGQVTLSSVGDLSLVVQDSSIVACNQSNVALSSLIVQSSQLIGSATYNVSGPVVLNAGSLLGVTVIANSGVTIGPRGFSEISGKLINVAGQTANILGATGPGFISLDFGGQFINAGTYNAGPIGFSGYTTAAFVNTGTVNFNGSTPMLVATFNNSGTVNYNAPASSPYIQDPNFINTGAINVLAGGLTIYPTAYGASNTFGGSLSIAAGANAYVILATSQQMTASLSGAGSLLIQGGGGIIAPAAYNFSGTATISSTQTIAANNSFGSTGSFIDRGRVSLAPGAGPGLTTKYISSLTINTSNSLIVQPSSSTASRTLLSLGSLSLLGTIDLGNNDMQLTGGSLSTIWTAVSSGYANGAWNGSGLTSITARNSSNHLLALGVIQNNQSGTALFTASNPFDGITPGASDILVKSTYYGDANLSGKVDSADYTLIDNGFLTHATGWFNGDFNYDGTVNGSDYTLIDNAFNMQGAQISSQIASATDQVADGNPTSIPEPGALGAVALLVGLFRRPQNQSKDLA